MPRTTRHLALIVAVSSLGLAGCWTGVDAQTSQPYTPANAVNATVGDLDLRGLALIAGAETGGPALLVGNVIDTGPSNVEDPEAKAQGDVLEAIAVDRSGPVSGTPLEIQPGGVAVLGGVDGADQLTVAGMQVPVGAFADVAFSFETAGLIEVEVPVVPVAYYPELEEALAEVETP